ncbi:MAG: RluA family pseudouridine synthase [Elusimicrobiota bacterium]|jgi:23S rRNA pseudouridine1911/1915/1917 synthase
MRSRSDSDMDERWIQVPFEVDKKFDGFRIDQFLSQRLIGYSRNKVQKILTESRVMKAGRLAKPNTRVNTGDHITIAYLRRPETPPPVDRTIPILFEDEHLLVVNKPSGVLSHPTDKIVMNTVMAILRRDRPDLPKLHLLHRLDRETSGVLALAKSALAARRWTAAMEKHRIQKEYLALVRGVPEPATGVIDWPIGCEGGEIRVRQWVNVPGAVKAITRYEVLSVIPCGHWQGIYEAISALDSPSCPPVEVLDDRDGPVKKSINGRSGPPETAGNDVCALVRAFPQTGRLHQIRVHLAAIGHPVLGDPLYIGKGEVYLKMIQGTATEADRASLGFPRVALHAAALTFQHPITGLPLRVEAPLPEEMRAVVAFRCLSFIRRGTILSNANGF